MYCFQNCIFAMIFTAKCKKINILILVVYCFQNCIFAMIFTAIETIAAYKVVLCIAFKIVSLQ